MVAEVIDYIGLKKRIAAARTRVELSAAEGQRVKLLMALQTSQSKKEDTVMLAFMLGELASEIQEAKNKLGERNE